MLNVVVDTNVFVSGLLSTHGNSAQIINAFKEKQFNLLYNNEILFEYRDVLYRDKLGLNTKDVDDLLDEISRVGFAIMSGESDIPLLDEDDRPFYDVAQTSGAILVTGNIRHFPNEPFIKTPADFLNILTIGGSTSDSGR
jgi:putative PIN family toxin of toxin-antitoxin system